MIIYKTTNLINLIIYIGKDKYNNPDYLGSGKILKRAIRKEGKENFKKEILEYCDNDIHLNEREVYWISYYRSTNIKMYNISSGGDWGDTFTNNPNKEEIRKKISIGVSIALTGKPCPESKKLSISKGNKNKIRTSEDKLNKKNTNIETYKDPELRKKVGIAVSKAFDKNGTREKLSKINTGSGNPFYNKRHSQKSIDQMSLSQKNLIPIQCKYCNVATNQGNHNRWHGENCKKKN
jgi:hypothetical protein